ncbi:MAG: molybdopterin-dependent oxidoreductase [Coriobacteriia bacterium]|nr:molybdopterin-dependent oxidoreductase [Coriobacteriia bacterium]
MALTVACSGKTNTGNPATPGSETAAMSGFENPPSSGSEGAHVPMPEWALVIETPDGEKGFSSADAAALTPVMIEATTTNKVGVSNTSTYRGVRLADILQAVGVSDLSGVTVVASDDFSADYDKKLTLADDTVLAWEKDGKAIDTNPPLQMAPKQGAGNQFVKFPSKIIVNP